MTMMDRTGIEAQHGHRERPGATASPSPALAAGPLPRGVALAIDYVILLAASAGLYGILEATDLGPDTARTLGALLAFALIVLYFAAMESGKMQATLGKLALGLKVADEQGGRISFPRALGRIFAKFLSLVPFGVGFVMAAFTERHRALHDMLAGTLVIRSRGPR